MDQVLGGCAQQAGAGLELSALWPITLLLPLCPQVRGTMENGKGGFRKGRKLASSRRRQIREPADGQDAPATPEPESWPSHSEEELQSFFQDCGARERGFITRDDLAVSMRSLHTWNPFVQILRFSYFNQGLVCLPAPLCI